MKPDERTPKFKTIDEYIARYPPKIQELLGQMRSTIQQAAPEATEKISYQLPTFDFHGNLVHFGAFQAHIGFYPAPSGIEAFQIELQPYKPAKGSVKFPIDEPLPLDLVKKITEYRFTENQEKWESKKKKK